MTVQADVSPGVEDYRSEKFEVSVNGSPAYVYGHTYISRLGIVDVWDGGDEFEASWLTVNADESTTVVITLADATPITSAIIYPGNAPVEQSIDAGVLTITLPPNTRLRIEINGDRVEVLNLFSAPLSNPPVSRTDYTTLAKVIDSTSTIDETPTVFTCDDGHEFTTGQRVIVKSTGTRPSTSEGVLPEYDLLYVTRVSATEYQLGTTDSGADIILTDEGTGTVTATIAEWGSGPALYFPAGVHKVGFRVNLGTNANVYMDAGAVVLATFITKADGIRIGGRGQHSGSAWDWYTQVRTLPFTQQNQFVMYDGEGGALTAYDVEVSGITVSATPFFINLWGVSKFQNVHHIAPWNGGSDSFSPYNKSSSDKRGYIIDCFAHSGDNVFKIGSYGTNTICTGSFAVGSQGGCFHFGYRPTHDNSFASTISDCHAITLGEADVVGGTPEFGQTAVFHALLDGYEADSALGVFGLQVDGVRVWGPVASKIFHIGNQEYPSFGLTYDLAGQLADWTVANVVSEYVPGQVSQILGRDADNAPRNLTFTGIRLGTVTVNEENYVTYFEVSEFATNITWDAAPTTEVVLTDQETLWAYAKTVYDSDGLVSLTNIRDRSATAIDDAVGEAAALSVIRLWPSYAQSDFDVSDPVHLETAVDGIIAMLWRRGGASTTIEQVKWDTVFGEGGTIEKLRRTSSRGRSGPSSNSRTITSTTTTRYYGWSDPASLPPGYLPSNRSGY